MSCGGGVCDFCLVFLFFFVCFLLLLFFLLVVGGGSLGWRETFAGCWLFFGFLWCWGSNPGLCTWYVIAYLHAGASEGRGEMVAT